MKWLSFIQSTRAKNNKRKSKSDVELIHEEIEKELSTCNCRKPFKAEWIDAAQRYIDHMAGLPAHGFDKQHRRMP